MVRIDMATLPKLVGMLVLLSAFTAPLAMGRVLTACVTDRPTPPVTFPNREGPGQYLIREAARKAGVQVRFVVEPRLRCINNVLNGTYEILAVSSAYGELAQNFAHPLLNGQLDPSRALAPAQIVLLRRPDTVSSWNGDAFRNTASLVIFPRGHVVTKTVLSAKKVIAKEIDTREQIVQMLILRRAQFAALLADDAIQLTADSKYATYLQMEEKPLVSFYLYAAFNKEFAAEQRDLVESIWTEIHNIRSQAQWPAHEAELRKY